MPKYNSTEKEHNEISVLGNFVGSSVTFSDVAKHYPYMHSWIADLGDEESSYNRSGILTLQQDDHYSTDAKTVVNRHIDFQQTKPPHSDYIVEEVATTVD